VSQLRLSRRGRRSLVAIIAASSFSLPLFASPQPLAAASSAPTRSEVLSFVQTMWMHGPPFHRAQDLGSASLSTLYEALRDQNSRRYWSNAVFAIGAIGDTASFDTLLNFIWDRFSGDVDLDTFRALMGAQAAFGTMSARSPKVLQYLERTSRPVAWRAIRWRYESNSGDKLSRIMSKMAIQSLSLSASPGAALALNDLRRDLHGGIKPEFVDEAIANNQRVRSLGLREYMRRFQEANGGK
jgi:hypothetical protein